MGFFFILCNNVELSGIIPVPVHNRCKVKQIHLSHTLYTQQFSVVVVNISFSLFQSSKLSDVLTALEKM